PSLAPEVTIFLKRGTVCAPMSPAAFRRFPLRWRAIEVINQPRRAHPQGARNPDGAGDLLDRLHGPGINDLEVFESQSVFVWNRGPGMSLYLCDISQSVADLSLRFTKRAIERSRGAALVGSQQAIP